MVRNNLTAGVSIALEKERYEREFRDASKPKKMAAQSLYGVCFRHILSRIIRKVEEDGRKHKLNIVIEGGHKNEGAALVIFNEIKNELEKDFGSHLMGEITVSKKTDSAPLMLADFLAFVVSAANQESLSKNARPPSPLSPNDAMWNEHITLAPNAFEISVRQFEEQRRRKSARHQTSSLSKKQT